MYENYLTPVFTTLEAREKHMNSLEKKFDTFEEWREWNHKSHRTMIELAAWYVRNNWEKVDWKDHVVNINGVAYNNKRELFEDNIFGKLLKDIQDELVHFDRLEFTYDESDGDLSVMVYGDNIIDNDDAWCFMADSQIIDAALYIESRVNDL